MIETKPSEAVSARRGGNGGDHREIPLAGFRSISAASDDGAEEFLTEFADAYIYRQLVNSSERSWRQVNNDAWYSALVGALTSGALNVSADALGSVSPKRLAKTLADDTAARIEAGEASGKKGIDPSNTANGRSREFWQKLSAYVDRAISKSRFVENPVITAEIVDDLQIGTISEELVERIRNKYGKDLAGFVHVLTDNDIRHIYNRHGPHTPEALPVTAEDIKLIPTIISNPKNVYLLSRKDGKAGLMYQYDGRHSTYYLEAIIDGEKKLRNKQMIKVPLGENPSIKELEMEIKKKEEHQIPSR